MQKSVLWKLAAVLVAAVLVHQPAAYACTRTQPVSPPVSFAQVYDSSFIEGCNLWVTTGNSSVSYGYATIDSGSLEQEFSVGSYTSFRLGINIDGIYGNAGSERYRLTIISGSTTELVDVFWPYESPSGTYYYDVNNYSNSTITIRIGTLPGTDPGDSSLVVNWIELWGRTF
jgi:hypothetical protein